jgi:hypothetical protein
LKLTESAHLVVAFTGKERRKKESKKDKKKERKKERKKE